MDFSDHVGKYAEHLHDAEAKSRPWLWLVAAGWIICPFLLRTAALNPADMIWLQYKLQGLVLPPYGFTAQQTAAGFVEAVIALAVLMLVQLTATVMFYRRSALDIGPVATPPLWPLAALLPGVLGNALWVAFSPGTVDWQGILVGLSPAWLAFGAEVFVNRLGKNFVYGQGQQALALLGQSPSAQSPSAQGPVSYFIPD